MFCSICYSVSEMLDAGETGNRQVSYQQVDLSDWRSVTNLTQRIFASESRLDVLINNAGIMRTVVLSGLR